MAVTPSSITVTIFFNSEIVIWSLINLPRSEDDYVRVNPGFFDQNQVSRDNRVYHILYEATLRTDATVARHPSRVDECKDLALSSPGLAVDNAGNILQYILAYEEPPPARNDSDFRPPRGYT